MIQSEEVSGVLKRYRFGLEPWALLLFALIMLPNILWAFMPAPDDVLRVESLTPVTDMLASAAQAVTIAALVLLRHERRPQTVRSGMCAASALCLLGYWLAWALYYQGVTNAAVILMMTLLPCAALLLFAINRRNLPAFMTGSVFTVCHCIFSMINFIC